MQTGPTIQNSSSSTRATCIWQEKTPLLNRRKKRRVHLSQARPGIRERRKRRFQRSPRTPIPPTQDASPRSRSRPSRVLQRRPRELRPSAPRIRTPEAYTGSSGHRSPAAPTDPRRRCLLGCRRCRCRCYAAVEHRKRLVASRNRGCGATCPRDGSEGEYTDTVLYTTTYTYRLDKSACLLQ